MLITLYKHCIMVIRQCWNSRHRQIWQKDLLGHHLHQNIFARLPLCGLDSRCSMHQTTQHSQRKHHTKSLIVITSTIVTHHHDHCTVHTQNERLIINTRYRSSAMPSLSHHHDHYHHHHHTIMPSPSHHHIAI